METKFKIGDLVYCIVTIADIEQWFVLSCEPIKKIFVDNGVTRYGFVDSLGKMIYVRERDCFLTKQEARAECKKRNIEIQKQEDSFVKRIKFLASVFQKEYVTAELNACEKENSKEIFEQLQYEAKSNKIQIRWKNEI